MPGGVRGRGPRGFPYLDFTGSEQLQTLFLLDLLQVATRDSYEFLVWFIPVEYDMLYEKMTDKRDLLLL